MSENSNPKREFRVTSHTDHQRRMREFDRSVRFSNRLALVAFLGIAVIFALILFKVIE